MPITQGGRFAKNSSTLPRASFFLSTVLPRSSAPCTCEVMGWMTPWRHLECQDGVIEDHQRREPSMDEITTIGIDLAKNIFQVQGVDASGAVVVRKAMRRVQVLRFFEALPRCLVGMEACATSHYWARAIAALGHEVRLMPPQYVKAYVKRNKNDVADAEAICEAVGRPSMRFVPVKSAEQQALLTMHRTRDWGASG